MNKVVLGSRCLVISFDTIWQRFFISLHFEYDSFLSQWTVIVFFFSNNSEVIHLVESEKKKERILVKHTLFFSFLFISVEIYVFIV